ncbi:GPO family capsid scaffolding protein [Thiothrix litoralis]|uniref:GPO family capsid scaffolding protein n=1 Tax=Thiothrix litoralis TaxID=2891210 RepID=A0ABX7WZL3_9GAMM|nr:GPO family capsid scaffolding protein [Thiothrix litoralis]QTR47768.1 GPO family capsid scaffolding protein [Thiothrix litoralis]
MDKLKTDWIRAAVSGETLDGRQITDQQVKDMADTYDPEVYVAHIWLEHIRGVVPEAVFKSLGDVVQVKAELIKAGALAGRMGLYVMLEPSAELVAMVRAGQKVHLSIEMDTDFSGTGKAYLMGVGVTDSPASLGTGLMKFSTTARATNIFSEPLICDMGKCQPTSGGELAHIRAMLEQLTNASQTRQTYATKKDFQQLVDVVNGLRDEIIKFGNQEIKVDEPRGEHAGGNPDDYHYTRQPVGY